MGSEMCIRDRKYFLPLQLRQIIYHYFLTSDIEHNGQANLLKLDDARAAGPEIFVSQHRFNFECYLDGHAIESARFFTANLEATHSRRLVNVLYEYVTTPWHELSRRNAATFAAPRPIPRPGKRIARDQLDAYLGLRRR